MDVMLTKIAAEIAVPIIFVNTQRFRCNHSLMKTYEQKLKLDRLTSCKLWSLSFEHAQTYNVLLDHLKSNLLDFKHFHFLSKQLRKDMEFTSSAKSIQNTTSKLIDNIKSYLSLKKKDSNARFPNRFKSTWNFTSFEYDWNGGSGGFKIEEDKLQILKQGKPFIEFQLNDYLLSKIKDKPIKILRFVEKNKSIHVQCVIDTRDEMREDNGIWASFDPGVSTLLTCVTSLGKTFKIPRVLDRQAEKEIDCIKSKRDKKRKYSNKYNRLKLLVTRKTKKLTNQRKDYHHKATTSTISLLKELNVTKIIYGDIQVKSLAQSASAGLNRATQNRGDLGRVKQYLAYKAEQAGIAFSLQNESYTSKTNCLTGEINNGLTLADRTLDLGNGIFLDRDLNGAINIAQKYFGGIWSASENFVRNLQELEASSVQVSKSQ